MTKVKARGINDENELLNLIKMIAIVAVIALLFYLLTIFFNRKSKNNAPADTKPSASIQYDEILVGNVFDQPAKNYYVLIEDINDKNVNTYTVYLSDYSTKLDAKRVYTAVLNNLFNKKYLSDTSNISNDITTFKVSGTTLIEVNNGKISKAYEGDSILAILEDLTK